MPKMHNFWCRYDSSLLYGELSTINQWTSAFNGVEKDGKKKKANRVEEHSKSYHSCSIETKIENMYKFREHRTFTHKTHVISPKNTQCLYYQGLSDEQSLDKSRQQGLQDTIQLC